MKILILIMIIVFSSWPLSAIEECVELTRADVEQMHGRNIVHIWEEAVPHIPLKDRFQIPGESPTIEQISSSRRRQIRQSICGGDNLRLRPCFA